MKTRRRIKAARWSIRERHAHACGLLEAAAWIEDAAGLHVSGSEVNLWLLGAAGFMKQRAEEEGVVAWYRRVNTYGG